MLLVSWAQAVVGFLAWLLKNEEDKFHSRLSIGRVFLGMHTEGFLSVNAV